MAEIQKHLSEYYRVVQVLERGRILPVSPSIGEPLRSSSKLARLVRPITTMLSPIIQFVSPLSNLARISPEKLGNAFQAKEMSAAVHDMAMGDFIAQGGPLLQSVEELVSQNQTSQPLVDLISVAGQYRVYLVSSMEAYGQDWLAKNTGLELTAERLLGKEITKPINTDRTKAIIDLTIMTARTTFGQLKPTQNHVVDQTAFEVGFEENFEKVIGAGLLNYVGEIIQSDDLVRVVSMPDARFVEINRRSYSQDALGQISLVPDAEIYESVLDYLGFLVYEKGLGIEDAELKKDYLQLYKQGRDPIFRKKFGREFKNARRYLYSANGQGINENVLELTTLAKFEYLHHIGTSFKLLVDPYRIAYPALLKLEGQTRALRPEIAEAQGSVECLDRILQGRDSKNFSFDSFPAVAELALYPGEVDKTLARQVRVSIQSLIKSHWDKIGSGIYI